MIDREQAIQAAREVLYRSDPCQFYVEQIVDAILALPDPERLAPQPLTVSQTYSWWRRHYKLRAFWWGFFHPFAPEGKVKDVVGGFYHDAIVEHTLRDSVKKGLL